MVAFLYSRVDMYTLCIEPICCFPFLREHIKRVDEVVQAFPGFVFPPQVDHVLRFPFCEFPVPDIDFRWFASSSSQITHSRLLPFDIGSLHLLYYAFPGSLSTLLLGKSGLFVENMKLYVIGNFAHENVYVIGQFGFADRRQTILLPPRAAIFPREAAQGNHPRQVSSRTDRNFLGVF